MGKADEDISTNHSSQVVIINRPALHRHAGAREAALVLHDSVGDASFAYERIGTCGGRRSFRFGRHTERA